MGLVVGVQGTSPRGALGVGVEGSAGWSQACGHGKGAGLFSTWLRPSPPNGKHGYQSAVSTRAGQREAH